MKTLDKKTHSKLPCAIALREELTKIEELKNKLKELNGYQAAAQRDLDYALETASPDDPSSLGIIRSVRTKIEVLGHRVARVQADVNSRINGLLPGVEDLKRLLAETGREEIAAKKQEIRRLPAPYTVDSDWDRGLDSPWVLAHIARQSQMDVPPSILANDHTRPGFADALLAWAHELLLLADKYEAQGRTWAPAGWQNAK